MVMQKHHFGALNSAAIITYNDYLSRELLCWEPYLNWSFFELQKATRLFYLHFSPKNKQKVTKLRFDWIFKELKISPTRFQTSKIMKIQGN